MNAQGTERDEAKAATPLRCTVIRHVEIEGLGFLGDALRRNGISFRYVDADSLNPGAPDPVGPLIVLGGPMSAYQTDTYPFLATEIALIERRLEQGRPLLGICLGAQLLAAAAGARVFAGARGKEIGWADIELTEAGTTDRIWTGFPQRFNTFHWHGDSFDIPDGAELLASSEKYPQAFRLGRSAYAVQFHPEVVPAQLEAWIQAYHLELEREQLSSTEVLAVRDERQHETLATTFGDNIAAWLRDCTAACE